MTAEDQELLDFAEFRRRVGASEQRVRAALFALNLQPLPSDPTDLRRKGYPASWVDQVKRRIAGQP